MYAYSIVSPTEPATESRGVDVDGVDLAKSSAHLESFNSGTLVSGAARIQSPSRGA
jgi:hypothetical protein